MKATPYTGTVESWQAKAAGGPIEWPETEPAVLPGLPTLYVRVTTPADQSPLHRRLARAGYVPELVAQDDTADYWVFHHPDGTR